MKTSVEVTVRKSNDRRHPRAVRAAKERIQRHADNTAIAVVSSAWLTFRINLPLSRLITDAPDRQHNFRSFWIAFDLGPQPLHMDINEPGVRGVPVSPHLLEQ